MVWGIILGVALWLLLLREAIKNVDALRAYEEGRKRGDKGTQPEDWRDM